MEQGSGMAQLDDPPLVRSLSGPWTPAPSPNIMASFLAPTDRLSSCGSNMVASECFLIREKREL